MISAAFDWYYGSQDEELLADCEFGEPYPSAKTYRDVCVRPATLGSGMQVTVFTQVKDKPKEVTEVEMNSKRLKLLIHPNILRHIGCVVTETEVHLVTERVSPLFLQYETADANEVTSGIYDVSQALKFLHEKAKLTHNNVHIDCMYITEGGAWKLSGFEWACPFSEATSKYLAGIRRPDDIIPPEEKNKKAKLPLEPKFAHCRDVYAIGILLCQFNDQTRFASLVKSQEIEDLVDEIMQAKYKARPLMSEVLDTAVMSSEYITIINFLQSVTLKNTNEKTNFFKELIPRIKRACISDELIAKRIAKLLLSPVVLAENIAVDYVIPRLLSPIPVRRQHQCDGLISSSMFARYVIPQIVDLLEIKLVHVRLVLLNNFSRFVHMFEMTVLKDAVLPDVLLGLHDCNNQIIKASLHALAESVPIVGGDIIVGTEREKIFSFGMPKFNGVMLVDTSAVACELRPKRKPKKVKRKQKEVDRPKTLLELAMSRDAKEEGQRAKGQRSRDLMMLKQNELAMTLTNCHNSNGSHSNESNHLQDIPSSKCLNGTVEQLNHVHIDINQMEVKGEPEVNSSNGFHSSNEVTAEKAAIENEMDKKEELIRAVKKIKIQKKKVLPEVEMWAASDSDNDRWDDFGSDEDDPARIQDKNIDSMTQLGNQPATLSKKNTELGKEQTNEHKKPSDDKASKSSTGLGNEFEIAVKAKPRPTDPELDLFNDMTPKFKSPKKTLVLPPTGQTIGRQHGNSVSSSITESLGSSPISMSYNPGNEDTDEADGWENETVSWD